MIRPSRVTVIVPAAVPNNSTDVNTNVSETEIVASIEGSLTVIEPRKSVSAARTNHCEVTGVEVQGMDGVSNYRETEKTTMATNAERAESQEN